MQNVVHFRFAAFASSSLKSLYVLYVKHLRISGFVLFVGMLAVAGKLLNSLFSFNTLYFVILFLLWIY